jgi:drug/metabolite transporter (DMT)-like permease
MSRRGLALFALMSVLWGIPYLLIKVAVHHLTPATVVEGRTLIGALVLLPLAARQGRIRELFGVWKPLVAYCICELALPWYLLTNAERRLPSSLSGLLVASVPLISAVLAVATGDRAVLHRRGIGGLLVGLLGVAVLLGLDVRSAELGSVGQVLVVALGYAVGPLIVARRLQNQSSLALAAVSLAAVALGYLPFAVAQAPRQAPPATAIASVATLGVLCTAAAFVAFFELLKEMPPTQATVITYFNPVVALILGVSVLGESLTMATVVGFILILGGSWFATGRSRPRETRRAAAAGRQPG